jgi:hypothetical protein
MTIRLVCKYLVEKEELTVFSIARAFLTTNEDKYFRTDKTWLKGNSAEIDRTV